MERDYSADRLKGYACLLVILGHVIVGLTASPVGSPVFMQKFQAFFYTFHMDLWMFLAGYVYKVTGGWKSSGNRLKFVGKKAVNLGVPYVTFSVIYIIVNSLTPGVNTGNSISDIINIYKTPVAQYWFLYSLFFIFVIWTVLSLFLNDITIVIVSYAVFVLLKTVLLLPLGVFDAPLNYFPVFGLGVCCQSVLTHKYNTAMKISVIICHFVSVIILLSTDLFDTIPCLSDAVRVFGIISSIFFIQLISEIKPVAKFLQYTNKYSFPIYLLHTFLTSATRILLIKFGITNYAVHVVAAMILGYSVPVLIGIVSEKIVIFNFFFYPLKTIKKLKKT